MILILDVTVLATAIAEAIDMVKTVVIPMIGIEAGMTTKEGTIQKEPPEDDTFVLIAFLIMFSNLIRINM